ncbi:MAG TPA: phosphohydrolase [Candidatus Glassbacteria bacterium]|nr:phosphohydrolase [Candidatus Glassbacteria bacterium]
MPEYREFLSVEEIAKDYAIRRHREVNHHYNALYPYAFHLQMTVDVANTFIHLIPEEARPDVIGGCWTHDIIEDARETYNNVLKTTNKTIAEYAYRCTNEKGRNRRERSNKKYYDGIKEYKHTTFVKLCDRIANITFSVNEKSSMINMYRNEYEDFKKGLYDGRFQEMWDHLEKLLAL